MDTVAERLEAVLARIGQAAREARRDPADVKLVAVTKTFAAATVELALVAGHRVFGENRVQEAAAKFPALRARFPELELHLIGPLQSNKASEAVALFDVIHSVDRDRIAAALAREIRSQGRQPTLLVQVNTGEEPQKSGVAPQEAELFVRRCREEHGLRIEGLMCIPPLDEPAAPHFALLRKLRDRFGLPFLSMGMSGDFEIAVTLGATHVRVGSAIFGERTVA
jgi:pyridoxal phosphate enzyme (YggS family)